MSRYYFVKFNRSNLCSHNKPAFRENVDHLQRRIYGCPSKSKQSKQFEKVAIVFAILRPFAVFWVFVFYVGDVCGFHWLTYVSREFITFPWNSHVLFVICHFTWHKFQPPLSLRFVNKQKHQQPLDFYQCDRPNQTKQTVFFYHNDKKLNKREVRVRGKSLIERERER